MRFRDRIGPAAVALTLALGLAVTAMALAYDGSRHGVPSGSQADE
jgi:hypothetical protein